MRTAVRRALLAVLALLAVALVWTGVALLQARSDLTAARELLVGLDDVDDAETALPVLGQAQAHLERAQARLRRPGPRLVALLPVVGRTVSAVSAVAETGAALSGGAREVLLALPPDLLVGGRLDLPAAGEVEAALRQTARRAAAPNARLQSLDLSLTPPAVAEAAEEARARARNAPEGLLRAADGLAALSAVLGAERERRLLVVLENNAELRAGGGLVSVFAEAVASGGRLTLGSFQEVDAVADPPQQARPVPAPRDFARAFGLFKADTTLWKNVNMAADVPTTSVVLAEVARATLGTRPDAIVWVDVPAMAAILRATGPVPLPDGTRLSAENAVPFLLSEAYARAEGVADGQARRQDELRAAGDAVLRRILGPAASPPAAALARELAAAAAGRHVSVWSADPHEQRLLMSARLAGAARADGGDLAAFATHNLGDTATFGNKLDFYSRRQVTVTVEVGRDAALVEQELAVRNTAPTRGLPTYVSGKASPGRLKQLVTAALPAAAEQVELSRDGRPLRVDPVPLVDHAIVSDVASLLPGQTARWRLRYRLPLQDGRYTSRLLPQPLAVDAGLLLEVRAAEGLRLPDGPVRRSGPYDEVVRVDVQAAAPSRWSRAKAALRRFWNEPVRLP